MFRSLLVAFLSFFQSLSLHSYLFIAQAHLEFGVWQSLVVVVLVTAAD